MNSKITRSPIVGICIFLLSLSANAQVIKVDSTSNWKKTFRTGLNINQASFTSNWKGGGVNSFGFNAFINYGANYKKGKKVGS